MRRETGDYIEDVIKAMNAAEEFVRGMDFHEFGKDTGMHPVLTGGVDKV